MSPEQLRTLLADVRTGDVSIDAALDQLKRLPYDDLGFAKIDHHRALRTGAPEVIYCAGKTPEQVVTLAQRMQGHGVPVLGTRATPEQRDAVLAALPAATWHATARAFHLPADPAPPPPAVRGTVAVCTGGTSDLPVAEEAALTAELLGSPVLRLYDVGVAGLHRLLAQVPELQAASVVVVIAGMEGALASVVSGLVAAPVIAVPTSVGYGAAFGGLAALLSMLNACAPGVAVVNIDNGFGAGYLAGMINKMA
jgi:NCAIR mutase (PurE)-related protein